MTVDIDVWQLAGLVVTLLSGMAGIAWRLAARFESRMDERLDDMEDARAADAQALRALERTFLQQQADLPLQYVMRPDYIRNQSVIEAKLDALANHTSQLIALQRGPHAN